MRSASSAMAFEAVQRASTMESYPSRMRRERKRSGRWSETRSIGLRCGE
jgi:hypothetical protein